MEIKSGTELTMTPLQVWWGLVMHKLGREFVVGMHLRALENCRVMGCKTLNHSYVTF